MAPEAPMSPRAVADKARELMAKVRPGPLEARRSLPIRRSADEVQALWDDDEARGAVLEGIPVADASLEVGDSDRDWGTTITLRLQLAAAVPGAAAQTLAGKALRRLKALGETGEVPTTEHNPSARADAGEETG